MATEEVEITIANDGSVQILVRGVKGKACLDLTRDLETALGGVVLSREMTPEAGSDPEVEPIHTGTARRVRTKRTS